MASRLSVHCVQMHRGPVKVHCLPQSYSAFSSNIAIASLISRSDSPHSPRHRRFRDT